MKNPLTLEERLSAIRLLDHDYWNERTFLKGQIVMQTNESKLAKAGLKSDFRFIDELTLDFEEHCTYILNALEILQGSSRLVVGNINKRRLNSLLETAKRVLSSRRYFNSDVVPEISADGFVSYPELLYAMLYNLLKNGDRAARAAGIKGHMSVTVSNFSGEVQRPVYSSPETPLQGDFVEIIVQDNGHGFQQNKPLTDYLKPHVSASGGGFGLYLVYLASKFLKSHFAIESVPGNTKVVLYHPVKRD